MTVVQAGRQTQWMTKGDDPWQVFVCHVPPEAQSVYYVGLPLRLDLRPDAITTILSERVTDYFDRLSHGAYHPVFSVGGEVTIASTDEPQACVDKALADVGDKAHGVFVVADAEHNATQPGGSANAGSPCATPPCPASTTRRFVYVGAADFSSDWAGDPPMDLIEHELGHALGWPHSGSAETAGDPHTSALDVMSNSAAPRMTEPERRDAPDTLAINRLAAGWLPQSAVEDVPPAGSSLTLQPSAGTSGTRLAVIALDDHRFLTVELLVAEGFDSHLPASGVAVHLVDTGGAERTQTPIVGLPPFDDLLTAGETLSSNGWSIAVADGWRVTMTPLDDLRTVST
jgi:hypothetical protein